MENPNSGLYNSMIQSFPISVDLLREEVWELGRKGPYFKWIDFPVEITEEIKVLNDCKNN